MKYAVLGGSFDPPHKAHLAIARAALASGYDRVILVPALNSPFKDGAFAPAEARIEALLAAIEDDRQFTVDDCELSREGPSYTIDTLRDLISRYQPDGKPALILGSDLLPDFHKWKDSKEITSLADLLAADRGSENGEYQKRSFRGMGNGVSMLPIPRSPISSTSIRAQIAAGDPSWEESVPKGSAAVIKARGMYGILPSPAAIGSSITSIEGKLRVRLSQGRFLHSRSTALLCADIAGRFHINVNEAYLAGIVHDVAKGLSDSQMRAWAQLDGEPFSSLELEKPAILHGRAGAMMLMKEYGVKNPAILEAVRVHTTAACNIGPLAKIVYAADKIEPRRHTVDPKLREAAANAKSLDSLYFAVMRGTVKWLRENGRAVADSTIEALENEA